MAVISIIVPIYNVGKYLSCCIDSIVAQTFQDVEIILVDDASTDECPAICDRYAAMDSRIKVIHKEKNEGLVSARKTGIKAASSQLIGYVDGDDWIEPDMYEVLYQMLSEADADLSICSRYDESPFSSIEVKQGIGEGIYDSEDMREKLFPHMIVKEGFFEWGLSPTAWDKLYRRDVLEPAQMDVDDSIMMGEDAALTFPMMLGVHRIVVSHRCLYHYRQSGLSMVRTSADADAGAERHRFQTLYQSVSSKLRGYADIYDMSEQWLKYVLFLMIPRSDVLYDGLEKMNYLFPFPEIKRGERVLIYCAGLYGQRLYKYLKESNFCECAGLADKDAKMLRSQEIDVITPDEISNIEYDAIAVASSFEHTRASIINDLKQRLHESRIYGFDYDLIRSRGTLEALGLI